jgi:GT2 family glycosyltransferase
VISVVIPSWNGRHLLEDCLRSLSRQTDAEFETIVIDNGSTDGTAEWLASSYPSVRHVRRETNSGFSAAVNAGIRASSSELIVLLNNDTEVAPDWLAQLEQASKDYPDYSIFASRIALKNPPGRIDTTGDGFTIAGFGYKMGWMQEDGGKFDAVREVFGASGCAAMYRRSVFDAIGYFDEDFFAFAEDLDFSFRANLAGFRCLYAPAAKIIHKLRSTAGDSDTARWYYRNLLWLNYKNFPGVLLICYFPHFFAQFMLMTVRSILHREFKAFFSGCLEGFRGMRSMKSKRTEIQKSRKISIGELRRKLTGNWIRVHWDLSRKTRR